MKTGIVKQILLLLPIAITGLYAWWMLIEWAEQALCRDAQIEPFTLYQLHANLLVLAALGWWWLKCGRPAMPASSGFRVGSGLGLFAVAAYLAACLDPRVFDALYHESGPMEMVTPLAALAACMLFARMVMIRRNRADRILGGLLAGFSLVLAMEELSWGQWIGRLDTPAVFQGNLQNEINLHNYFNPWFPVLYDMAGWGMLLLLVASIRFRDDPRTRQWLREALPGTACIGLLLLAFLFRFWHEVFEEMTGMILLFHAWRLGRARTFGVASDCMPAGSVIKTQV